MAEDNLNTEPVPAPRWFIDLDWYRQNARSFPTLVRDCLCPRCRERLEKGRLSEAKLVASLRDCCSQAPDFISGELPILTGVFRILLAGGNEPLELTEISRRLGERLGGEGYRASVEVLSRLLKDEHYYGIRPAPD
ncbi:MAG: hypothetical protein JW790_01170 [Dehalococcoidales bacterium]|nr:hypothetical protein [Dehalococcoidales bacterium]